MQLKKERFECRENSKPQGMHMRTGAEGFHFLTARFSPSPRYEKPHERISLSQSHWRHTKKKEADMKVSLFLLRVRFSRKLWSLKKSEKEANFLFWWKNDDDVEIKKEQQRQKSCCCWWTTNKQNTKRKKKNWDPKRRKWIQHKKGSNRRARGKFITSIERINITYSMKRLHFPFRFCPSFYIFFVNA